MKNRTTQIPFSASSSSKSKNASIREHFSRPGIFLSILGVVILIVYDVSLSFQFAWDDTFQIVDNPLIRSWSSVPRAFMSDLWFHVHRGQLYYRPLFTTWSIFNYSLFRLNPWGWHLTAVLLHVAAVCVFFFLSRKLGLAYWTAAGATVIFALHPIHIESVSWISAASDTMVALFYMAAFLAFLKSTTPEESRKTLWRSLSLAFLACGLLTKEMAVTFFLLVAVYTWMFLAQKKDSSERLRQVSVTAAPYLAVTLIYLVLRKFALHSMVAAPGEKHSMAEWLITIPHVLAFYLWKFLVPVGLTGLYYTPYLDSAASVRFLVSVIALGTFAFALWYWQKQKNDRMVAFLGAWCLLTIIPVLYLPNFRNGDFVRDRYAYIPSIGLVLLAAKAIALLPPLGKMSARVTQVSAVCLICVAFTFGASQQIYWNSDLSIFQRGTDLYPDNQYAQVGLARVLERIPGEENRAIDVLTKTIAQSPGSPTAYFLLAEAYSRTGNLAEGRAALAKSLSFSPDIDGDVEKADLAGLYGRLGDYASAQNLCSKVLASSPDLLSGLYNCGKHIFRNWPLS